MVANTVRQLGNHPCRQPSGGGTDCLLLPVKSRRVTDKEVMNTLVLIVEDDAALRGALCQTMEFGGFQVLNARNGKDALAVMDRESVDIVISDVQMDEMGGTELLQVVRREPGLPFVMMTAHGSVQHAVQAMRDGATDYLQKPFEANVLLDMVSRMENHVVTPASEMIAEDAATQHVLDLAQRVALTNASVLISGESGTGKEVLARAVHESSERSEGPIGTERAYSREHVGGDPLWLREGCLYRRPQGPSGQI